MAYTNDKYNEKYDEEYNEEYTLEDIDLLLDIDNIKSPKLKYNTQLGLKNSIISEWKLNNLKLNLENKVKINPLNRFQNKLDSLNYIEYISEGIEYSNKFNEFIPDYSYDNDFYNILYDLNNSGIDFDTKFNPDYKIKINTRDIIFPICCVGKNRSQYMFYYLKVLESIYQNHFVVGYPSSGDELSVITDYINMENKINLNSQNILSGYSTRYKKDSFSSSISKSFQIYNPDKLEDIPRFPHTFDKVLKKNESYENYDLKNFEYFKYIQNKYDIFDKANNNIYEKIIKLYIKYFLNPSNLLNLVNSNIPYHMNRITYICMSEKSFYNLCLCFSAIKKSNPDINFKNIRIVYFAIQDIFQKSNIKDKILLNFKEKITSSFEFVLDKNIL